MRLGRSAARTDPGRKRRGNEDAYVLQPPLFAIADGMGGAQAGEVASALAAGALTESGADGGGESRVVELIQEANRRVHERASTDAATSGMGTTITVALVEGDGAITIGHVGDSRAYRLRDDQLEQLTDDHSLVAELVRRGELSPQEAEVHPQRSVITRALGTDPDVDVDAFTVQAEAGDVYLICSDGLSDMLSAGTIEEIVRRHRGDLDAASRALVQAANKAGGEDNITAVMFEIAEGEPEPAETAGATTAVLDVSEEDTLHPEDGVAPPPPRAEPTAPRETAAVAVTPDEPAPPEPPSAVDTMVVPADDIDAAVAAAEEQRVPFARKLLAVLVILALIALIVVLVVWGLAR